MKKGPSLAGEVEGILFEAHKARPRSTHRVLEEILLRLAREIDALKLAQPDRDLEE
jgi:hypothetical protein